MVILIRIFMNQKGQGLLEALVATTIIVVGISGVMGLAGNNLTASNISTSELVAVNLAREAVEILTNIRDSNYLDNSSSWNQNLDAGSNDINGILEYDESTHTWAMDFLGPGTDFTDSETIMYLDANTGLYRQNSIVVNGWTEIPYRRVVSMNRICDNDITNFRSSGACSGGGTVGYRIVIGMQWNDHGNIRELTLEKRIFNWR